MIYWALLMAAVTGPAVAADMAADVPGARHLVPDRPALLVSSDCRECSGLPWGGLRRARKAHLPFGGLRNVHAADLPWGGLRPVCPPARSTRRVVLVRKG